MLDPAGADSFDSPLNVSVFSVILSLTFLSRWLKAGGENSVKQKMSDRRSCFSFPPLIGRRSEKPLVSGGEEEWAECFSDVCVAERKVT